jgi:hypothetical protein
MNEEGSSLPWAHRLVPTLIDLLMLAGMIFLVPWLGPKLFQPTTLNHILLIPGFVLIVVGILAIRSLPSYPRADPQGPTLLTACLVFFQMVIYCLCYAYGTNIGGSEADNDGVAVILFFALLLPVIGAFTWPMTRALPGTRKALVVESIGLVSVNYLTLIGASVWEYYRSLPVSEESVPATGISFVVLYAIFYVLFLAFFGLPRIYLLRATGDRLGLALYLLGVAIFLWNKVPPLN